MTLAVFLPSTLGSARLSRRMADELRRLGRDPQVLELPGRFPDPDQAAIYAVRTAWSNLPAEMPKLIAGEVLGAFAGLPLHRVSVLLGRPPEFAAEVLRDVPRVVVASEAMQARLTRDLGVPAEHITIIAPGIDPLPRSPGTGGPGCAILSVGDVIPRKGHDVLLRALSRLPDLDWTLLIAGAEADPVYAEALRSLVGALRVGGRVRFGLEPDWDGADLFALASHDEGYGLVIAEALRRGLPVAVTNVGAVPTLVGPEAGVVCAPGDVEQLSKALRRLIFDRALRRDMAEVAWQSGQALPSWPDQAKRLAELVG